MSVFMALCIVLSTTAQTDKWAWHRDFLKGKFDLSGCRQSWSSDLWYVQCIFFDMDGDGVDEVFTVTPSEEDGDGHVWRVWSVAGGRLKQVRLAGDLNYYCDSSSFFRLLSEKGHDRFLGIGMNENRREGDRRVFVEAKADREFLLRKDRTYCLDEIKPDVDSLFRREGSVRIERLYPEWYFGFDFKPPTDTPHNNYTRRMPYRLPCGDLRRGGGVSAPVGFQSFVESYRQDAKRQSSVSGNMTVHVIFLDVNGDGAVDCYVSSSVEKDNGRKLRWSLYVNKNGVLTKEPDEEQLPNGKSCLASKVVAGRSSFCRVVRYDAKPEFIVLDGGASKTRVREILLETDTHFIEKLPCQDYPEQ